MIRDAWIAENMVFIQLVMSLMKPKWTQPCDAKLAMTTDEQIGYQRVMN